MEQNISHDELRQKLKGHVFVEPATRKVRSYLVAYVSLLVADAKELSRDDLLASKGHDIAMDVCGVLAWQSARGVKNDGWLNEESEPILSELLDIASVLDADSNHPYAWRRFFELAEQLN